MSPLCRQLAEVVRERYLSGPEKAKSHGILADFFSGAWSQGIKKLITLPLVGKPLNLDRKVRCLGTPAPHAQPPHFCADKARAPFHPLFPPQMPSTLLSFFSHKGRKVPEHYLKDGEQQMRNLCSTNFPDEKTKSQRLKAYLQSHGIPEFYLFLFIFYFIYLFIFICGGF